MAARRAAHALGHGAADDVDEFARRLDGLSLPRRYDECGDALRPAFLAVVAEDAPKLRLVIFVDDLVR